MDARLKALIVIGPGFKKRNIAVDKRFKIIRDPKSIAGLMASSDLAITAFGTTLYELAYMGVPALIISNFRKDKKDCLRFEKFKTAINLGYHGLVSTARISGAISKLMSAKKRLSKMLRNGKKLVDGKGASRIVKILEGLIA
jgi:spore coat polysaccharide biosynthesis predicted glycosyltransferase SpsG